MQAALPCRFLLRVFLAFAISVSLSSDPDTNACGRPEGKSKLSNRFAKIGDLTPKRANDLLWWTADERRMRLCAVVVSDQRRAGGATNGLSLSCGSHIFEKARHADVIPYYPPIWARWPLRLDRCTIVPFSRCVTSAILLTKAGVAAIATF
jgi:hypothetical protein